jgi:hypothetical protein
MSVSGGTLDATLRAVLASAADPIPVRLVSAADHLTPVVGATPTVLLAKADGPAPALGFGAFAPAAPADGAAAEVGHGLYAVPADARNFDTPGPMLVYATAPGADPYRALVDVVPGPGLAPIPAGTSTYPLAFVLGAAGLAPTVLLSRAGAGFAGAAGGVAEPGGPGRGNGFYFLSPNGSDTGTPGALALYATATGGPTSYVGHAAYGVTGIVGPPGALAQTMLAVRALVVNAGLFPPAAVAISQEEEPFPSPAPPCCWLALGEFPIDDPIEQGVGRYNPVVEGTITANLVLRRTRDVDQQDTQLLTNAAGGLPLVDALIDVLHEEFPLDGSGAPLTSCGLKLAGIGRSRGYGRGRDMMMAVVPVRFRVRVMLRMNVP